MLILCHFFTRVEYLLMTTHTSRNRPRIEGLLLNICSLRLCEGLRRSKGLHPFLFSTHPPHYLLGRHTEGAGCPGNKCRDILRRHTNTCATSMSQSESDLTGSSSWHCHGRGICSSQLMSCSDGKSNKQMSKTGFHEFGGFLKYKLKLFESHTYVSNVRLLTSTWRHHVNKLFKPNIVGGKNINQWNSTHAPVRPLFWLTIFCNVGFSYLEDNFLSRFHFILAAEHETGSGWCGNLCVLH